MKKRSYETINQRACSVSVIALTLLLGLGITPLARADAADAKRLLQAMSDYLSGQTAISFAFDAVLEVVTEDDQKLGLASSGTVKLNRPDKLVVTRTGGFFDVEVLFDGKTLTLFGKTANLYTQGEAPGTVDQLVDELRDKHHRPLPAADLLMSNPYKELMLDVVDTKDLGSGVIGGVECDHLAFRKKDVDWEIWIAQGDKPYPCRYVITSKLVSKGPQYSIQIRDWKAGSAAAGGDFTFRNTSEAKQIDLKELREMDVMSELPEHFRIGKKGAAQ